MGKKNSIVIEAYTRCVKDRVKEILLPFPSEPSMSIKLYGPVINHTSEVDELKRIFNNLGKEKSDLKSRLSKMSLEKETLKFNLN